MNSIYGFFSCNYFEFKDISIARMITGYGRLVLSYLVRLVEMFGWSVVYGDTDSIFVTPVSGSGNPARLVDLVHADLDGIGLQGIRLKLEYTADAILFEKVKNQDGKIRKKLYHKKVG